MTAQQLPWPDVHPGDTVRGADGNGWTVVHNGTSATALDADRDPARDGAVIVEFGERTYPFTPPAGTSVEVLDRALSHDGTGTDITAPDDVGAMAEAQIALRLRGEVVGVEPASPDGKPVPMYCRATGYTIGEFLSHLKLLHGVIADKGMTTSELRELHDDLHDAAAAGKGDSYYVHHVHDDGAFRRFSAARVDEWKQKNRDAA